MQWYHLRGSSDDEWIDNVSKILDGYSFIIIRKILFLSKLLEKY